MSETGLSRMIRAGLAAIGVWAIRVQSGMLRVAAGPRTYIVKLAEAGTPDLCLPALGWLEVKTQDGALSPSQVAWHARAAREGVRVAVVRSVGEAVAVARSWQAEARSGTRGTSDQPERISDALGLRAGPGLASTSVRGRGRKRNQGSESGS